MCYSYNTGAGVFRIQPSSSTPGLWDLLMEDEILGSYSSPEMAADDVYMQASGYFDWDNLEPVTEPQDLSAWAHHR